MIDGLLRALHVPWWVPFVVWYLLYALMAMGHMINGYAQEYLGWRHPGRPGKIHKVIYRFHTGLHVDPSRSYGDEKHLRRAAGNVTRATPEGLMVYFSPLKRWHRALRNNLAILAVLSVMACMVDDPADTVRALTVLFLMSIILIAWQTFAKARKARRAARPIVRPAFAVTRPARAVMGADPSTAGSTPRLEDDTRPQLEGVPPSVLSRLLGGEMNASSAEIMSLLSVNADSGTLALPETYPARISQRASVEELIASHTKGRVRFEWNTTETPRTLRWFPVIVPKLPDTVRFRDYLTQIESLGARETGLGVRADRTMYVQSHNGDLPWWCRFMGSGTGKSMSFLVKAAQIAHKDPTAQIYCVDTKQVSFEPLHGIPGIHIFDNPVTEMDKMWEIFYTLNGILVDRYSAVREKRSRLDDFGDIWLFVDEGNHLGGKLKNYWTKTLGESSASPSIWAEAIAPLLQQGRQGRIFGEFMFQDLTDRAMGNQSLKFAFGGFCAAGFLPNQFGRTIGTPAEDCLEGPGKILVCQGKNRTWTQGFIDDEQWLHDYALANRKRMAA